jgi:hypothetical protein
MSSSPGTNPREKESPFLVGIGGIHIDHIYVRHDESNRITYRVVDEFVPRDKP